MKKKKTIIFAVLGAVIVVAFALSHFIGWPVDSDNASGDIAKSSRFSRQLADAGVSNMQELLQTDEEFKNDLVTAYMVMKTRSEQFNALVDMSAEVAGDIAEFESVLKEMKDEQPMINNVVSSMEAAGNDLNAALGGETADDLEQNTSNAALAYSTLQKQNKLADQFIATTDEYLKKESGNDRLKFVRDQWVDYQRVTAVLDHNEQLAQELGKKGYQLSEAQRAAALSSFSSSQVLSGIFSASLGAACGINDLSLSNTLGTLDNALSAHQRRHELSAVNQDNLGAVEQAKLGAVEQKALQAVQEGALGNVFGVLVSAIQQGGLGAVADQGKLGGAASGVNLGAVADQSKLGGAAVGKLGAAEQAKLGGVTVLDAVELGGVNVLSLSLGGMDHLQSQLDVRMIGSKASGANVLGMSRPIGEFMDAVSRPGFE